MNRRRAASGFLAVLVVFAGVGAAAPGASAGPSTNEDRSGGRARVECPPGLLTRHGRSAQAPGNQRRPACPTEAGAADGHRSAAWEAAAAIQDHRRRAEALRDDPPPPTEPVEVPPAGSICPTTDTSSVVAPDHVTFSSSTGSQHLRIAIPAGAQAITWDESTCPIFTTAANAGVTWDRYAIGTYGTAPTASDPSPVAATLTRQGEDPARCNLARASVPNNDTDCWMLTPTDSFGPLNIGEAPDVPNPVEGSAITGGTLLAQHDYLLATNFCGGCDLRNQDFVDVNLRGAWMDHSDLRGATIVDTPMDRAVLWQTVFGGSDEQPTRISGVSMSSTEVQGTIFALQPGDVVSGLDMSQAASIWCPQFSGGVFTEVTFPGSGSGNSGAWSLAPYGSSCDTIFQRPAGTPTFSEAVFDVDAMWPVGIWNGARIEDSSVRVPDAGLVTYLQQHDLSSLVFTNSRFIGLVPDLGAAFDENGVITTRTDLAGATLDGSRFSSVNMQGADLTGASLAGTLFSGADLWQAIVQSASASNADFATARVWDATFTGATLTAASFAGADAHGAQFGSVSAERADFAGAYLFPGGTDGVTPVTFSGSDLSSANFSGALLGDAVFDGPATRLVGASFTDAQCISCNFTNATMVATGQGVDFQRSYLYGTTFATSLNLANFTGATCCATIPPNQTSLAWEFATYVPTGQDIEGPDVSYDDSDLASADVQGATCPNGTVAGASGCTGAQVEPGSGVGRLGCVSAYVYACPPTIATLAGNGQKGFDPTDEFARSSPLGDPSSVVVTPSSVLFADPANHVVREVTNINSPDPTIGTWAGTGTAGTSGDGGPATDAALSAPSGLAMRDSDGAVAVADRDADVVRLVAAEGTISTIAGDGTPCADPTSECGDGAAATGAQLTAPSTVWFAPNDDLYVADTGNHKIRVVDADTGVISTVAGDGTVCATMAVPACGDAGAARAAQLSSPTGGLIGDQHGNVYVSDTGTGRVRIIDPTGDMQSFTGAGALVAPTGIAIDAVGNRYIADQGAHAIYRVGAVGIPVPHLWAGTLGTSCADPTATTDPCGDGGLVAAATFDAPTGIFVAPGAPLSLWVADTADQRIRHASSPF